MDLAAMSIGNLEAKALRCGYSAAPLGEAYDAFLRRLSVDDRFDLNHFRDYGREMKIDPYALNCAEVAAQIRRIRSQLLLAK